MDTASAIAPPPREAAQNLSLTHLELRERGGILEVSAIGSGLCVGTMATPNVPGVADAVRRLAREWTGMPLLHSEERWRRFGRDAMQRRADRLAFGALDIACTRAAAVALDVSLLVLLGGGLGTAAAADADGLPTLDADASDDLSGLAADGLARGALVLTTGIAGCGGIAGLRRIAALARALGLDLVLRPTTASAVEAAVGATLAAAFGAGWAATAGPPDTGSRNATIKKIRLRRVTLPLARIYVSAMYLTDRVQRTIVEVETTDGVFGLGECGGTDEIFRLAQKLARGLIGADAFDRRGLYRRFAPVAYANANGRSGCQAIAGLELACWDATAKTLGLPLADLLGRADPAPDVAAVCLLPSAVLGGLVSRAAVAEHLADPGNARRVADHAAAARERWGFGCFKYKSTGTNPAWDLAVMRALRETLGPDAALRFDPNAAYAPATAAALCRKLEPLSLEFYEDPTDGIEGLARLRALPLSRPIASNMVLIGFDQFGPAVRRRAVDILLADAFHWGGIENFRDMAAAADAFGLPVAIHSFYESGIGTAAHAHLALGLGLTHHAVDQGHQDLLADVVDADAITIRAGRLALPRGPGLGVVLDEPRLRPLTCDDVTVTA